MPYRILALLLAGVLTCAAAQAAERLALAIANGDGYRGSLFGHLDSPPNDLKAVVDALGPGTLGAGAFEVIAKADRNRREMKADVEAFVTRLRDEKAKVALFYFTGHAIEGGDGINFLIPVGEVFNSRADVREDAVSLNWLVDKVDEVGVPLKLVVLDACRNDIPDPTAKGFASQGLAAMNVQGSLIAFASQPRQPAWGGTGKETSVFTRHWVAALKAYRHAPIETVFRMTKTGVVNELRNQERKQDPWYLPNLTGGDFCLAGCPEASAVVGPVAAVPASPVAAPPALPLIANRYRDNGDGTVTDVVTRLQWMRCSVGQEWTGKGCRGEAKEMDWKEAKGQKADFAGHGDWRLPAIEELRTLVYCSSGKPAFFNDGSKGFSSCEGDYYRPTIVGDAYPNMDTSLFWSASPVAGHSYYAWNVDFNNGDDYWNYRYNTYAVRLVRAGQ